MSKMLLVVGTVIALVAAGCTFLEKVAPPQYDEAGNPIPGSPALISEAQTVVGAIPYGEPIVALVLFGWGWYERFRANKLNRGLMATLSAGKLASEDPATKEAWERLLLTMKSAHKSAGVYNDIRALLAKL